MPTATRTSKSQVTIPTEVRAALGIEAGDRVGFIQVWPGRFELVAATKSKGLVRKPVWPVTIAAMSDAIKSHGTKAK